MFIQQLLKHDNEIVYNWIKSFDDFCFKVTIFIDGAI